MYDIFLATIISIGLLWKHCTWILQSVLCVASHHVNKIAQTPVEILLINHLYGSYFHKTIQDFRYNHHHHSNLQFRFENQLYLLSVFRLLLQHWVMRKFNYCFIFCLICSVLLSQDLTFILKQFIKTIMDQLRMLVIVCTALLYVVNVHEIS